MTQPSTITPAQAHAASEQASSANLSPSLSQEGQALLLLAFVLVQSGKFPQALAVLEGVRHGEAQSTACLPLLTHCYLELGLFAEALPLAQELRRACTGNDALCAARMVAQALWGLHRHDEARAVLEQTIHYGAVQPHAAEGAHAVTDA